jgi:hypothetical protein
LIKSRSPTSWKLFPNRISFGALGLFVTPPEAARDVDRSLADVLAAFSELRRESGEESVCTGLSGAEGVASRASFGFAVVVVVSSSLVGNPAVCGMESIGLVVGAKTTCVSLCALPGDLVALT